MPIAKTLKLIKEMSESSTSVYGGGRADDEDIWDKITILAAQLGSPPFDSYKENCDLSTEFGGRYSKHRIKLDMPVIIAGMSYGSISKSAKLAIHYALNELAEKDLRIALNTGEGGALYEELNERKYPLILQYASGKFGINLENIKKRLKMTVQC